MSKESYNLDLELIVAIKKGDNDALKYIYKTYWPMILRFVLLNNGNKEDAEELYQEGIIILYEKSKDESFTLICSLKTYIYSICRNVWLYKLRSKKQVMDIESYADNLITSFEEEEILLPEKEEIHDAIIQLGNPCKALLIGFYYDKLNLETLAENMGYQNGNVAKQQKFRCIERLKKIFLPKKLTRML